jgi:hypothetical protein
MESLVRPIMGRGLIVVGGLIVGGDLAPNFA